MGSVKIEKLYDKKFVYFEWDKVLKSFKVCCANDIETLKANLGNSKYWHTVSKNETKKGGAFIDANGNTYNFVYFDPHFELRAAILNGEIVQEHLNNLSGGGWKDINYIEYDFDLERAYRIIGSPRDFFSGFVKMR